MAKKITYTEAYNRLQEVLRMIEGGQLEVDQLSGKIKEAGALLKFCKKQLLEAEEDVRQALEGLTSGEDDAR